MFKENDGPFHNLQEDYWVNHARRAIYSGFGHNVTVAEKQKALHKFGRNSDLDTGGSETVWEFGGNETYATSNTIDTISSSNAGDTQEIILEGHTLTGSSLVFNVQSATLNGQNKVTLATPLYRASRLFNNGSTDFAGNVYIYEDTAIVAGVPSDLTKAHLLADGATNQTEKCATSLSHEDYWLISQLYVSVGRQISATVNFHLQVRLFGKVFRTIAEFSSDNNAGVSVVDFRPFLIIPPNSDIRVTAETSANNSNVTAAINGLLARVEPRPIAA